MVLEGISFRLIENKIGYTFKDISLLEKSLSHSSYVNEKKLVKQKSNERLGFLGDALLGLIVSKIVFHLFPFENKGVISEIRNYWVSEKVLASMARKIGIDKALLLGSCEEKNGGRHNGKILANSFEALVAAMYLDGGIKKTEVFLSKLFKKRIKEAGTKVTLFDFKTRLQEICQEKYKCTPKYLTKFDGRCFRSEVVLNEKTIGKGIGKNKKESEQEAAKNVLEKIEIEREVSNVS